MEADEPPAEFDEDGTVTLAACGQTPARAAEPCYPVLDPLDELSRRLRRGCFSSALHIELSNIEDHRLDYHFLAVRGSCFNRFTHVRARAVGGRYTLTAHRGSRAHLSADV